MPLEHVPSANSVQLKLSGLRSTAGELALWLCSTTDCQRQVTERGSQLAGAPLAVHRRPLAGMRLAIPQTVVLDAMEPAVSRAFDRAIALLSAAGAQISDIKLAELAEIPAINAPGGLSPIEAYAVHH